MKPKSENAATAAKQAAKDEEGYSRDWEMEGVETTKPQIDEGMRWSTKSWVTKVENIYWSGLPTPPPSPPASESGGNGLSMQNEKIISFDPRTEQANRIAQEIIGAVINSNESDIRSDERADQAKREFLRTRYRKVESDISGLTAKW